MKAAALREVHQGSGNLRAASQKGGRVGSTTQHGKDIALLSPPQAAKSARLKKRLDFAARLKRIYRDLVLPGDVAVEERKSRPQRAGIGETTWTFNS
jgi:hypothetical protein